MRLSQLDNAPLDASSTYGETFANKVVVMLKGKLVAGGETAQVFAPPFHPYTELLLSSVPELHKKWQHAPPGPVSANGSTPVSPNGGVATALTRTAMLDELSHGEPVVKRDPRAFFGANRAVASGKSHVAVTLEPPALHEFEPDHLVADLD